jgi:hypothetical protein
MQGLHEERGDEVGVSLAGAELALHHVGAAFDGVDGGWW